MRAYINTISFITEVLLGIVLVANQTLFQTICEYFQLPNASMWIGIFVSSFFIGLVVVALISGELAEHIGKKNVIAIFSFIVVGGCVLLTFATSAELAMGCIFVLGLGFGAVEGLINSVVVDENKLGSAKILNIANVFFSVGAILSPLIISGFIEGGGQWKFVYYAISVLYTVLGILFLIAKPTKQPTMKKKNGFVSFKLFKNKYFLMSCIMIFVYIGAENGATAWNVNIFNSTMLGAWALAIFWAAMGVSRLIAGFIKREKLYSYMIIMMIIGIAGFTGVSFLNSIDGLVLASFGVIGFGLGPLWPSFFAMGLDHAGEYSGAGSGCVMLFSSLGGVVLPLLLGALSGFNIMIAGIVFLAIIILIMQIYIHQNKIK